MPSPSDDDVQPAAEHPPLTRREARAAEHAAEQAVAHSAPEEVPQPAAAPEQTTAPIAAAPLEDFDAVLASFTQPVGVSPSLAVPRADITGEGPAAVPAALTGATTTGPTAAGETVAGKPSRAERRAARTAAQGPKREKPERRGGWGCLIVVLVVLGLMVGGYFAVQGPLQQLLSAASGPEDYEGAGEADQVFMIHEGDIGEDIAQRLTDEGITKSFDAFYDLLLKQSPTPVFHPGAYNLAEKMSAKAALDALLDPANKLEQTVVIPEGTAAVDVLAIIAEGTEIPIEDLQAAALDVGAYGLPPEATSLEGFLFPATYTFNPGATASEAITTLVNRQMQALDEAGVAPADRWKTIILASLIQREAGLRDDYYKVSRVFLNRLDPALWDSGLLQSDATVAYGTGNTHLVTTTDAERADEANRYNTYVHPGLPIGPISNPGDLAIDAALHPADGSWLFFVTWNLDTGETIFSSTVEEHEIGVEKWLAWMDDHPEYG